MALPAELRLKIYSAVIEEDPVRDLKNLSLVCRTINTEVSYELPAHNAAYIRTLQSRMNWSRDSPFAKYCPFGRQAGPARQHGDFAAMRLEGPKENEHLGTMTLTLPTLIVQGPEADEEVYQASRAMSKAETASMKWAFRVLTANFPLMTDRQRKMLAVRRKTLVVNFEGVARPFNANPARDNDHGRHSRTAHGVIEDAIEAWACHDMKVPELVLTASDAAGEKSVEAAMRVLPAELTDDLTVPVRVLKSDAVQYRSRTRYHGEPDWPLWEIANRYASDQAETDARIAAGVDVDAEEARLQAERARAEQHDEYDGYEEYDEYDEYDEYADEYEYY
ncbi:hypothetical protein GMOD_00004191 [Pyrenophora seminiperda CCB06]|uniref:Uncharacterized protein n=1 Tax=Pyrenophora seminiperda CCB06 TaxID=1302712 RepID=A0A3M7M0R5_9PLEO|nr:hypothetical protein GMOD_00004191 [Pyrenophora seminiperda CCB06]